jgi:ornithine cyclodeaminase/alanine dehydrogenase-like protein (mu-crystallin family)
MAIYLSDEDVQQLLTVPECIDVLDDLFRQEAEGKVQNISRVRARHGNASTTLMGGSVLGSEAYGIRHSSLTLLYNTESGRLDAALQPSALAWIRTGAASGLATKYMARPESSVVGIIGSGRQAVTQLQAVCAVRPIERVKAYSRSAENRERFAAEMQASLGIEVTPVESSQECVQGSDILITITNAREPVFDGNLLEPGMHINAAGANNDTRQELDATTIRRADVIAVDNLEQARLECGELIAAAAGGTFQWERAIPFHAVVSGKVSGRPDGRSVTLFESMGIGIEDIAASAYVLRKAREQGLGQELPF